MVRFQQWIDDCPYSLHRILAGEERAIADHGVTQKLLVGCSLSRLFFQQVELSLLADEFLSCKLDASGDGDGRVGGQAEAKIGGMDPNATVRLKVLRDGKLREAGEFSSKEEPASIGNAKSTASPGYCRREPYAGNSSEIEDSGLDQRCGGGPSELRQPCERLFSCGRKMLCDRG